MEVTGTSCSLHLRKLCLMLMQVIISCLFLCSYKDSNFQEKSFKPIYLFAFTMQWKSQNNSVYLAWGHIYHPHWSWLKTQHSKIKIMASGPISSWQIYGETKETVTDFIWGGGSKITVDGDCSHEIKRYLLLGRKVLTNLDSVWKKQGHYFANKGLSSQSYGFSSSHFWMWELDHKESWTSKNWYFELWC